MLFERHRQIPVCRTEHKNRIPKIRPPTSRTMRKVGGLFYPQNPKKEAKDLPRNGISGGWFRLSSRVLFVTFRGDESSPLHLVPCIGWYHSTTRVVIPTWWAAGSTPRHVIPTAIKWSGGIFPSCMLYLTMVISATWVDSSTPLRYGRNDIPERWFC